MLYEEVLKSFRKHGVKYLIVGGMAAYLHGVPRTTFDMDIAADLSLENVKALLDALAENGLVPMAPVDPLDLSKPEARAIWKTDKNMKALSFQTTNQATPYREIDVVFDLPLDFETMYSNRIQMKSEDTQADIVSLKHLVEMKEKLGRDQDLLDIKFLKKIQNQQERHELE